ncbi:MAG: EamA family transporter [Firmicutes bacterium]|nr:EamA family transporter [Bacillota bacterium]
MKSNTSNKLKLILSMAVFGTIGLFTRNIAVTSGELALYRAVLAAVLIMAFLILTRHRLNWKGIKKDLKYLILSGAAMGFNWIFLFQAYNYTTISVATLCYYFAPVIVTVACVFCFRERLNVKQILCFVMSTVGLVLIIANGGLAGGGSDGLGILYGLGAAALYAAVILLNKFMKHTEGIPRTLFQFLAAIVVLTPYVAATSGFHLEVLDSKGWICLLILGLFHTGITYCLYFSSLKVLKGQEVSILSYIDPLVAVLISTVVLGEAMTLLQGLGGLLILGFTLLNELGPGETPKAQGTQEVE